MTLLVKIMITHKIIPDLTWFPTELTLDDKFDHNLKIVSEIYDTDNPNARHEIPPYTLALGFMWKGVSYILIENEETVVTPANGTFSWVNPPTVREFLEKVKEPIPNETTVYSYYWIAMVKYNEKGKPDPNGRWYITDKLSAQLLVKVSPFNMQDILKYVGIGLIAIGVLGLLAEEKEHVKKAYEYVKEKAPEVYRYIREKAPEAYEKLKEELAKLREELRRLKLREEIERIIREEIGKLRGLR